VKKLTATVIALSVLALIFVVWSWSKPGPKPPASQDAVFMFDVTDSYRPPLLLDKNEGLPAAIEAAKKMIAGLSPGTKVTITTIGSDGGTPFIELRHTIPPPREDGQQPLDHTNHTKQDEARLCDELDSILKAPTPHLTDILAKLNDDALPRGANVSIYIFTDARQCDKDGCLEGKNFKPTTLRSIKPLQQSHVCFVGVASEGLSGRDWDRLASFWREYIKTQGGVVDGFTQSMEATRSF
jgi:hypothetical protein